MKKTDFLEDRAEKEDCLVTSDSTDFFVVIHDWLLERGDVTEGDKKEHLEGFDGNCWKTNRKTRPSILCVTHQMNHKKRNYSAVPFIR